MNGTRIEHDLLGEKEVNKDNYYGIQTLRALENFQITGIPISHYPVYILSLMNVKKAAALTNKELGLLPEQLADAIVKACDES